MIVRVLGMMIGASAALAACAGSSGSLQDDQATLYEVSTMVLQAPGEPAMLCLGAVATSFPPQCGTYPIPNWDWERVAGETSSGGTTWGVYHIVGALDGDVFTLTEPPGSPQRQPREELSDRFATPCDPPEGGWVPPDPARATENTMGRAADVADAAPDVAGFWIDDQNRRGEYQDPQEIILNVAYTGNLEAHEAELRAVWGGSLCVIRFERTEASLRAIQDELMNGLADELGLEVLSIGPDTVDNVLSLEVAVVFPDTQAELDGRYGEGVVRVTGVLRPVTEDD